MAFNWDDYEVVNNDNNTSNNFNWDDYEVTDVPNQNIQVLTGGVEQKVIPNWDKKGRIYYTDEQGNKIKSNVPLGRKLANKIKATTTNIGDWLTTDVGEAAKERKKAVALLTTAPIGAGAGIGGMALSGALGGGLYSGAEQAIEGKFNPKQLATDIGLGAATGGLLGLGGKYVVSPIVKNISRRANIAKRRATPLAERMTEEQLQNVKPSVEQAQQLTLDFNNVADEIVPETNIIQQAKKQILENNLPSYDDAYIYSDNGHGYLRNQIENMRDVNYKYNELLKKLEKQKDDYLAKAKSEQRVKEINETYNQRVKEANESFKKSQENIIKNIDNYEKEINITPTQAAQPIEKQSEVFYTPWNTEVIKNPTNNQKQSLVREYRRENPNSITNDDPIYRTTYDTEGNEYIWKASDSVHEEMENFLKDKFGVNANQDISTLNREYLKKYRSNPEQYSIILKQLQNYEDDVIRGNFRGSFDSYLKQLDEVIPEQVVETTQTGKIKQSALAQKANKSDEVAQAVQENPPLYEAITNADTMLQAQNEISQNASKVHTDTIRKLIDENAEVTALDVEKARQIFNELQKQGRFDEATDLLELTSRQGSKLGQAVQAFSLWSKTTPDGAMLYAQKLLDKYNKGVRKKLQKRLTENELKEIGEAFQKLNESGLTGRELEVETAKAMKKVFKVVPKTFAQKLDGYRYINMLLSGKSRIKDFLLTGKNAFDTAIDETIAGGIDAARSALSKDKTRYISANPFVGAKAWLQGAKKGFKEGLEDVRFGINTSRSGEVGRYGLPSEPIFNMPTFEGNLANRIMTAVKNPLGTGEKLLRYTMQVPDRMFFEARYASSLANQMKARGVKEPTQDMINRAVEEAKRAVFQENRPITQKMTEAAKFLDTPVNIIEDVAGLPKGTLPSLEKGLTPFVKTPTNVIAQGAEGLHGAGSGSFMLRNAIEKGSPEAIREAELLMGRGIRGLGELGLGYAVGKNIIDNIKTNIGEKDYYANEITGLKPNSIVIGDKAISLQNMQNNLPFFSGVGLGQKGLGQALINTGDVIAEMPALKALGDLYNINKEAKYIAQSDDADKELLKTGSRALRSLGANYLTSLIPYGGALGELRNDIDPNARELYMPDLYDENALSGLGSDLSYLGNRLVNRLPFVSNTLPVRYNSLGEPVMVNNIKNPVGRILSEAIDFGIRNYNERPAEMKEMQRLQDYAMENNLDGKTTLKFAKPKRYLGRGKDKIKLNNKQYSELTRLYGSKVYDELQFLMNTPEYQSQDDETKIKWVREVLKEKKKEAEEEIFDIIK